MSMALRHPIPRLSFTLLTASLLLWAEESFGTTNENFNAVIANQQKVFKNPQPGQEIRVRIGVEGISEVRQISAQVAYDPEFFDFDEVVRGNLLEDGEFFVSSNEMVGNLSAVSAGVISFGTEPDRSSRGIVGEWVFILREPITEMDGHTDLSLTYIRAAMTTDDADERVFAPGVLTITAAFDRSNKFEGKGVKAFPRFRSASIQWKTQERGIQDVARVDELNLTGEFVRIGEFEPNYPDQALDLLRDMDQYARRAAAGEVPDVDFVNDDVETIRAALNIGTPGFGLPDLFPDLLQLARPIYKRFLDQIHLVEVTGLTQGTHYRACVESTSLTGNLSPGPPEGCVEFDTRSRQDLRRAVASNFDCQRGLTSSTCDFDTNRLVKTSYSFLTVEDTGPSTIAGISQPSLGEVVATGEVNPLGAKETNFTVKGLDPGTRYGIEITAELVGEISDDLPPGFALIDLPTRIIRTRARLPGGGAITGPPAPIPSSQSAVIKFNTPLAVVADVFFAIGPDVDLALKATANQEDFPEDDFTWMASGQRGTKHEIELSGLDPLTNYVYKIEYDVEGGERFSTRADGNTKFSGVLEFDTTDPADQSPPALTEGPRVFTTDVIAVAQFRNDVASTASVFVGTASTLGTSDEYEFSDGILDGKHSIVMSGLDQGVDYLYRIEYTGANGVTGIFSGSGDVAGKATAALQPPGGGGAFTTTNVPDTQFPVILTGPTVSSKTHDTAIVEWTTDEPADSDVQFGTTELDEQEASGVSETSHKITLPGLTPGTTYQYIVASTDASGNGATQSATAVFTTDPEIDLTAPSIVGTPSIGYKNESSATVLWTTNEEATGKVEFGTDAQLGFIRTLPETETVHEITLTNLEASTEYFYRVSSTDLSNNGPTESSILSFTTDAAPDLTSPTISNIQVEEDETSVIITWDTNELADSFVDFGTTSGLLTSTVGDVEDVTEHEITMTNLESATTYFYTVGSIDRANNPPTQSSQSSFTTLATADVTAPAVPAGLDAIPGSEQVVLSWDANDELDLAGYRVERRAPTLPFFTAIASGLEEPTYTDLGLSNSVEYEYRVLAVDRSDNASDPSEAVAVTPVSTAAPTTPTELAHSGALRPTFRFDNAEPFAAGATLTYTVQVSTESDFSNVTDSESGIVEDGDGVTTWTITRDLVGDATYYWRVRALEGALIGPWTEPQEFAAAAVALVADFNGDLKVNLDDFFDFIDVFGDPVTGASIVYDLDDDGRIGLDDFFIFIDHFGDTATAGRVWAYANVMDEQAQLRLEARGSSAMSAGGAGAATGTETDRITVRLWADQVGDLEAYALVVGYDPRLVRFVGAQQGIGPLLESQGGSAPLFSVLHRRKGELVVGNGLTDGDPVSGYGLLGELTFETLTAPTSGQAYFELRQAFIKGEQEDGQVRRVRQVSSTKLLPQQFFLGANYPNPFNPATQINFALPVGTSVELKVYDVLGQLVRTLVAKEHRAAGFYNVVWNGRDESNRGVGSGVYFYRLKTPAVQHSGRMTLLK